MTSKLNGLCNSQAQSIDRLVTAGQVSDRIDSRALLSGLPKVDWLLGNCGYDANWFREASKYKGIRACMPGRKQR